LTAPTGKLKTSYLSIKDMQHKSAEAKAQSQQEDLSGKEQQPYTYDDLKKSWRKYAHAAKAKGQSTLYSAMIERDPIQKDKNQYEHLVDNQIQQTFFNQNLSDVMHYLRSELRNWSIQIEIGIESETNASKTLYSGKDKFQDMAKRNPHLNTLKQKFKLNIEF
jgi:DNA polymerase-3 subunit gamma/tau